VQVLVEYLHVWDLVDGTVLQQDIEEQYKWKLTPSGSYSSKSTYLAFFIGTIKFSPWRRIWKSWPPYIANLSFGWCYIISAGQLIA
jgi:hypothetical protein